MVPFSSAEASVAELAATSGRVFQSAEQRESAGKPSELAAKSKLYAVETNFLGPLSFPIRSPWSQPRHHGGRVGGVLPMNGLR